MHRHNISITMLQIVIKVVSSKPVVLSDATSLTVFIFLFVALVNMIIEHHRGYCNVLDLTQVSLRVKVFPGLRTLDRLADLASTECNPYFCNSQ